MHLMLIYNGDDSDNESGEDEEITHSIKKILLMTKTTSKITWHKHTLLFGKTRQCKFILGYYLAG